MNIPVEKAGNNLADSVDVIVRKIADDINWKGAAHKDLGLIAFSNVIEVGGKELVEKLSQWAKFGRRSIDDVVDDLANVSLDASKMAPEAKQGYQQLISELAAKGNKAKGAAHALRALRYYQDKGIKILRIEAQEAVDIAGTRLKHSRRFDMIIEVAGKEVRIECKSWIFENVTTYTRRYMGVAAKKVANQTDEVAEDLADFGQEGAQLFADLLSFAQKNHAGHKWAFDDAMTDGGKAFKETIMDVLENNSNIRNEIRTILKINETQLKNWVDDLALKLDTFVEVIPKK